MSKYCTFCCNSPSSGTFHTWKLHREALFSQNVGKKTTSCHLSFPLPLLFYFYFLYIKVNLQVMVNRLGNLAKTQRFDSLDTDGCVRSSWGPSCVTFQERRRQGPSTLQTSDALQCKERDLLTAARSDRPFRHRGLKQTSSRRKPALCAPTVAARLSTKTQPSVTSAIQTTRYFIV